MTRAVPHLRFFLVRLVRRESEIARILNQIALAFSRYRFASALVDHNNTRTHGRARRVVTKQRRALWKVRHSSSVNYKHTIRALHAHDHLVGNSKVVIASTVQKNIFRMLYPSMWKNELVAGG